MSDYMEVMAAVMEVEGWLARQQTSLDQISENMGQLMSAAENAIGGSGSTHEADVTSAIEAAKTAVTNAWDALGEARSAVAGLQP
jgi:hypothetical protein